VISPLRVVFERVVAVHRGYADQIEMARGKQDGDEIVVAGVAIDQDLLLDIFICLVIGRRNAGWRQQSRQ
jgi:hypothetical protein